MKLHARSPYLLVTKYASLRSRAHLRRPNRRDHNERASSLGEGPNVSAYGPPLKRSLMGAIVEGTCTRLSRTASELRSISKLARPRFNWEVEPALGSRAFASSSLFGTVYKLRFGHKNLSGSER